MARHATRQISFADAEMHMQGVTLDPMLQRVADLLDRRADLVDRVYDDLVRGLKRPRTGRDGISAAQVLRSFLLARIKNWDLRELRERIADGYTLRVFTQFFASPVANYRTLNRNFNRLRPETVRRGTRSASSWSLASARSREEHRRRRRHPAFFAAGLPRAREDARSPRRRARVRR